MKKVLMIAGVVLMVIWICGVSFFMIQQIGWNHYIVSKVNENIDAINSISSVLYTPASDAMVR